VTQQTLPDDALDTLVCEFEKRPRGAPSFFDLERAITAVERGDGALMVTFAPGHAGEVRALVAAERLCCPTIDWRLDDEGRVLRVSGTPAQLDVLHAMLSHDRPRAAG
jgi:hypothetical protein